MSFIIGLLVGLAAAFVAMSDRRLRAIYDRTDATNEPLSVRLHQLAAPVETFTNQAAHPRECAEQPAFLQAKQLLLDPRVPLETVTQYALGVNLTLATIGLAALAEREDRNAAVPQVLGQIDRMPPWTIHFALDYLLAVDPRPPVGAALINARDWWAENTLLPLIVIEHFDRRQALGDRPTFGSSLQSIQQPAVVRAFLATLRHPFAAALMAELDAQHRQSFDRGFLTSFGRFWSVTDASDLPVETPSWRSDIDLAEAGLELDPPRSLLVSGEAAVGKTSFLKLLAERASWKGWFVFEASGADLMAGQLWFGQLEERVKKILSEIAVGRRVIWYVPDLLQLARSGTHQGQSASILDQIMPALTIGRLVIWTESTPAATSRLLQLRPVLRDFFEIVRLEPLSEDETSDLLRSVSDRLAGAIGVAFQPDCVPAALDAARQYLNAASLPGSAVSLLKLAASRAEPGRSEAIGASHISDSLAQLTGLPVSILDNRERIDLDAIRSFFASRVIGQDEAVDCIVERIAMLKAGLNDPAKPIGVFLFAGPTGTGKTELAKTTAEYLFGTAERMIRLDMSEFQTAESTAAIVGEQSPSGEGNSLISRVRKQPFSVVLLDEFEKSHPRVWDLFLQVFDDGRLSDPLGQVADFRHCIIILTSNLGATVQHGPGLGFAPTSVGFSSEPIMEAIRQTYRPEFQNRIDRVVVFRPFTRELMRNILKKELDGVLERRGLKDRAWAIEWESTALEFLLERGFSPDMGARPLKRAIDQYVLAPLAATIVERRFPQGDQFVFFRSDGRLITAEFVDPDADTAASAPSEATGSAGRLEDARAALTTMIFAPGGTDAEAAMLHDALDAVERDVNGEMWSDLKSELVRRMEHAGFWSDPQRFETLARLALIDRVEAAIDTARSLSARLDRGVRRSGSVSRELVSRVALQLHLVGQGIRDVHENAPVELAILVEPALESGGDGGTAVQQWCSDLTGMYREWARRRNMQVEELPALARNGQPILVVAGFGAHRVLAAEVGLHILERPDGADGGGRVTARVCMERTPLGDLPAAKVQQIVSEALVRTPRSSAVVRRYRRGPSPLVRNASGSWRSGKLGAVMQGDFDILRPDEAFAVKRTS